MDSTEDLSARVLFKHILNIEPPRTPLTRSATAKSTSGSRRSSRLGKNDDGAQTPQSILRRSLKHKIRESISNKTLPTRRRTASTVLKNTPAPNSMLFDDGDTPRHILKNILLTEPVKSPVVNEQAESEDQQPQLLSPNSSLQSRRPSIELSGLELPDLTIGNFESTVKGLSRKRPRRSLNVTAFEKRLKERNDIVEEDEESLDDHSSLSLSSSTSLSLKTPFTDVRTEKKGLQRRGSNRRKVTEEEFCAAVNKRQIGNYHGVSSLAPEQGLSETTYSDFTLGVSKLSEPDITTDIVHCNTALYAQTDGIMSNDLTLATQDKPTVMASQIQRDMEEQLDAKQQPYSFPLEENTLMDAQDNSQFVSARSHLDIHEVPDEDAATTSKSEQEKSLANHTFDIDDQVDSDKEQKKEQSQAEEADSQTEGNAAEKACSQDQDAADIQTENEDQTDAQSSDDVAAESEKEESAVGQQSHQEAPFVSLRLEDEGRDSQTNDEHEAEGDKEEVEGNEDDMEEGEGDEEEDEDDIGEDKEEVEGSEDDMEEVEDDVEGDKEEVEGVEDDIEEVEGSEEGERLDNLEHISRRAPCTEGALIMPIQKTDGDLANNTKPGYSDTELKGDDTRELHNDMDLQNTEISQSNFDHMAESPTHKEKSDVEANLDANKENSFHENDVMHDDELPEHVELEEQSMDESEEEEEENEDIPSMMPAFVKQKRNFFYSHPQASPFVPKNIQPSDLSTGAPAAQPKQRAQRKPRSPKSDSSLPKSYLMNVFKHFAKTKVSADVYPVLKEIMDRFFDRLAKDLEAYALHAKRSTIEVADCELLLRRAM